MPTSEQVLAGAKPANSVPVVLRLSFQVVAAFTSLTLLETN